MTGSIGASLINQAPGTTGSDDSAVMTDKTGNMAIDSSSPEHCMDVDWFTIAEDSMPVKLVRGQSACDNILDFTAKKSEGDAWEFDDSVRAEIAWKTTYKLQPGLIVGSERLRDMSVREQAIEKLKRGATHVEALADMY